MFYRIQESAINVDWLKDAFSRLCEYMPGNTIIYIAWIFAIEIDSKYIFPKGIHI